MPNAPSDPPLVEIPPMCATHKRLLVHQARYTPKDPWVALILASQIALMQAMTADDRAYAQAHGKLENFSTLGCFACYLPDKFGEIVEAAKAHDLGRIKALGERWVTEGVKR